MSSQYPDDYPDHGCGHLVLTGLAAAALVWWAAWWFFGLTGVLSLILFTAVAGATLYWWLDGERR